MTLRRTRLRRKTDPKTGKHALCDRAQAKCTWTFEKRHFVWKFTEKCRTQIPRPAFCASLHSRNAHGHLRSAILCGNLQEKSRTPIPQHFVRACAVETHMDISQGPFCRNLQEKCRTLIPRPAFCASLRSRNAHGHFRRAILYGNLQGKSRTRMRTPQVNTGP